MAGQHPKLILIAADEVLVRNLLRQVLQRDYEVLIAANFSEALQLSRRTEGVIHILLCGIKLPGMNELSLSRQIRAERPQIKVLFIRGALRKPFEIGELRTQLEQLLAEPMVEPENP